MWSVIVMMNIPEAPVARDAFVATLQLVMGVKPGRSSNTRRVRDYTQFTKGVEYRQAESRNQALVRHVAQ